MPFGANRYRKPGRGGPLSSSRHQLEQETPDVALGGEPQVCFLYLRAGQRVLDHSQVLVLPL
jgi:hypothetical protein